MEDLKRRLETDETDVGKIVKAFTLPKLYADDFRLASEGAGMKSACANMSVNYSSDNWDTAVANNQIPSQDCMGFLFGNPLRAFILFMHNPGGVQYRYEFNNPNGGGFAFAFPPFTQFQIVPRFASVAVSSVFQPHGPILFPGYDEAGNKYIWCDCGTGGGANSLDVDLNVGPAATTGMVTWWKWDGETAQLHDSQQFVVGQKLYTSRPPVGGAYMFVRVYTEDVTITSCQVTFVGNEGSWSHHPVSDIQTLMNNAYGIRVNSAGVKVQNNASDMNKNGDITSVTVSKSIPWSQIASGTATLSTLQNYRDRVAETGYYGFLVPDSDEDVSEFFDDISASSFRSSTLSQFSFPLSERRPYKAIGLTVPINAGRSFTWDVTHAVEYTTNNKLVTQGVSPFSEDSVKAAVVIMSVMDSDYENPTHWTDIVAKIGKYVPSVARAVAAFAQAIGQEKIHDALSQRFGAIDSLGGSLQAFKKKKTKK